MNNVCEVGCRLFFDYNLLRASSIEKGGSYYSHLYTYTYLIQSTTEILFSTHIKYINGFTCKLCCSCSSNIINIFRKFSSTGIHSSKTA